MTWSIFSTPSPDSVFQTLAKIRDSFEILGQQRLTEALVGFWNRTLTSNRLSGSVKGQRLIICMRVIEVATLPMIVPLILDIFSGDLIGLSGLVEIGSSLGILRDGNTSLLARGIILRIISINNECDKRWKTLVMDELDISKEKLRRYLAYGNSLLLANLIHITGQFFDDLRQHDSDSTLLTQKSLGILSSLPKFDINHTLPEMQHRFCDLWNEIVKQATNNWAATSNGPIVDILFQNWKFFVALHPGYHDTSRRRSSYPPCDIADHRTLHTNTRRQGTDGEPIVQSTSGQASGTGDSPRPNEGINLGINVSSTTFNTAVIISNLHPPHQQLTPQICIRRQP